MAVNNVLLVTIDSLRYDYLEEFRSNLDTHIPFESFENTYATGPGTSPSFPGILTGTLPLSYDGLGPLTEERPRLAAELRRAGVRTGGFQCNPFLSQYFNYEVGFDAFEDYQNPLMGVATKLFPRGIELNNPRLRRVDDYLHLTDLLKKSYRLVKGKPRPYVAADVVTDDALEWLQATDERFFGWVHYMDVHHPCFPPGQYRRAYGVGDVSQARVADTYAALLSDTATVTRGEVEEMIALYRSAIAYVADQIDRVLGQLATTGRLEETMIVITSDHGELFGEHGQYGKPERMFDELLQVPLLVENGPEHLGAGTDQLISLLDLPPLIHDALDVDVPDGYAGQRPVADSPRDYVLAEHQVDGDVIVGARSGEWLYEADQIRCDRRLVDVSDGRFERVAVDDHPEATWLIDVVHDRLEALDVSPSTIRETVDGDVRDRLEELGYLE